MAAAQNELLFALVARGKEVLAEYTPSSGNFTVVTRMLLTKFPEKDGRMSYRYDRYMFHLLRENGILFLCMTSTDAKRRIAFAFLDDIKTKLFEQYGSTVHTAIAFAFQSSFAPVLKRQMEYFSDPSSDRYSRVRDQLDEVKSVMVENIEKILERGEKIELLVDKSSMLTQSAQKFEHSGRKLRRTMWLRNLKMKLLIAFIVLVILGVIIGVIVANRD